MLVRLISPRTVSLNLLWFLRAGTGSLNLLWFLRAGIQALLCLSCYFHQDAVWLQVQLF